MADSDGHPRDVQAQTDFPLRVLLIEDHPDLAAATAEFLRMEGLDVQIACSGQEALALAVTIAPHIVLCDMHLPDMSGVEVVHRLRSHPSTVRSYLVILTAMSGATL